MANASPRRVWSAYIVLTFLHLFSNYTAMRVLALRSLNRSRMQLLMSEYLKASPEEAQGAGASPKELETFSWTRLDPSYVARKERIFTWRPPIPGLFRREAFRVSARSLGLPHVEGRGLIPLLMGAAGQVRLGVRLKDLVMTAGELARLQTVFKDEHYLLYAQGKEILISLREDASKLDQLKAYFHVSARGGPSCVSSGDDVALTPSSLLSRPTFWASG